MGESALSLWIDVDELLTHETEFIDVSKKDLALFDPAMPLAFELATELYRGLPLSDTGKRIGLEISATAAKCAKVLGIDENTLSSQVSDEINQTPEHIEARQAGYLMQSRRLSEYLYLLVVRQYMWAVTDFLRMRLTAATMHSRLQIEAIGLISLFKQMPDVGPKWMRILEESDGRKFFNKYHKNVREELKQLDLLKNYDFASGHGQHARLVTLIRGLEAESHGPGDPAKLNASERHDDFFWYLWTINFLEVQQKILKVLPKLLHIEDVAWDNKLGKYSKTVKGFWTTLQSQFPHRVANLRLELQNMSDIPRN